MGYWIATAVFLGICTFTDLKKQQIWWPLAVFFGAAATGNHLVRKDLEPISLMGGIGIGLVFLVLSWSTREAVGYGDGLVVAACGAALGFLKTMGMVTAALCLAAVWSGILLAAKKARRGDSFPFIPFLLAAEVCGVFVPF